MGKKVFLRRVKPDFEINCPVPVPVKYVDI